MDTRPDENGMAPRRRQHFRMLGLLRHPAEWRPEDYQHRGAQCCSVFVLGRRPPWLLVQLKLGVSPAHCSAEGQVHLDELPICVPGVIGLELRNPSAIQRRPGS